MPIIQVLGGAPIYFFISHVMRINGKIVYQNGIENIWEIYPQKIHLTKRINTFSTRAPQSKHELYTL